MTKQSNKVMRWVPVEMSIQDKITALASGEEFRSKTGKYLIYLTDCETRIPDFRMVGGDGVEHVVSRDIWHSVWRRKTETPVFYCNGVELEDTRVSSVENGQHYWAVDLTSSDFRQRIHSSHNQLTNNLLERGLLHHTEQGAIDHCKALLGAVEDASPTVTEPEPKFTENNPVSGVVVNGIPFEQLTDRQLRGYMTLFEHTLKAITNSSHTKTGPKDWSGVQTLLRANVITTPLVLGRKF